jgi:DNA adenine methylase
MSYLGAKSGSGVFQAVISQMPPHDCYIETHLGTGAVLRAKPPATRSIAIEIDPDTLAAYPPPAGVEVIQGDALAFLKGFDVAAAGRVLVYFDPPYLPATRTSTKRYRFDLDEAGHLETLAVARDLADRGAAVMVSGYPSDLYDRELAGWRRITFQAMTRGGVRTEALWLSFPAGAVAWSTFAGRNFTDRQRIKRKAARWAANYAAVPPAERLAILAAILDVEGQVSSRP